MCARAAVRRCACVRACACVCVCVCARARTDVCVLVCAFVRELEGVEERLGGIQTFMGGCVCTELTPPPLSRLLRSSSPSPEYVRACGGAGVCVCISLRACVRVYVRVRA